MIFQSTPPVWAETSLCVSSIRFWGGFQSTPPVWAETNRFLRCLRQADNFNPLRPCGRRLNVFRVLLGVVKFQSTPPVWAETHFHLMLYRHSRFQSTPPVWAETEYDGLDTLKYVISIHSARVGGDLRRNSAKTPPS